MGIKILYCGPNLYSPEFVSDLVSQSRRTDISLTNEECDMIDNLAQKMLDRMERGVNDGHQNHSR